MDKKLNREQIYNALLNDKLLDNAIYEAVYDKAGRLQTDNPKEYGGYWDPNPYGVDAALIGSSGCWEFPSWGEDAAWDNAKILLKCELDEVETMVELDTFFDNKLPDECYGEDETYLELYNETDVEWMKIILKNKIEQA